MTLHDPFDRDQVHALLADAGDGQVVVSAGKCGVLVARSEGFYVVLEGEVEVVRPDVEREQPVGVLAPDSSSAAPACSPASART